MSDPLFYTPPEVARILRCRESKVSTWIRQGVLQAVNVSTGTRPRYRVGKSDLDAFLQAKVVVPTAKPERRQRRDSSIPRYV